MDKNVSYINQCSQIENEALDWLILLDGDHPPTDSEIKELKQWLSTSAEHRKALRDLTQFWSDQSLTELYVQVDSKEPVAQKTKNTWSFSPVLVACFMLVAFISWFNLNSGLGEKAQYFTSVGEQKEILLSDGSIIHLDTNSQIKVDFSDEIRALYLKQGQVFFNVAKDKQRPFRVFVDEGRVEAIGTAFNIALEESGMNLLVTEGVVAVAKSKQDSTDEYVTLGAINAGNQFQLPKKASLDSLTTNFNQKIVSLSKSELENGAAWLKGALVFNNEALIEVVKKINKYSNKPIVINEENVADIKIGGRFNVGELEAFLNLLESSFSVKVIKTENEYLLEPASNS